MSAYRRFVTYLFRYEEKKKENNCGFAKVEVRQDKFRIELQITDYGEKQLPVYLFVRKSDRLEGIYLGDLSIKNGRGGAVFVDSALEIGGTPYGIDEMRGLYLSDNGHSFIASQWDDADTDWSAFLPYQSESGEEPEFYDEPAETEEMRSLDDMESFSEIEKEAEETSRAENRQMKENSEEESEKKKEQAKGQPEEKIKEKPEERTEEKAEENPEKKAEEKMEEKMEEKSEKKSREIEPELKSTQVAAAAQIPRVSAWEQQWRKFTASHPIFRPFDEKDDVWGVKLDLRDFKIMPKKFWGLANNSFLLHGYFNYRYVLFGYMEEEQKRWFMGVPGIFHNQECMLAGIFGFPEFETQQKCIQKTGEFGYWYRYLDI